MHEDVLAVIRTRLHKWDKTPNLFQYPHLVYGAIASSAPVKAQVNFEGYNDVVEQSFNDALGGGSKMVTHCMC